MHKIEVVHEERLTITLKIDGKYVCFTRKGNPDVVYSATMISDDLSHLLEATASSQPLCEISFHLAGTNIIRLIDVFCIDAALQSWRKYAEATIDAYANVREIFYQFLGFKVSHHLKGSTFCAEAKKIGEVCKREKILQVYHDDRYFNSDSNRIFNSEKGRSARNIQRQEPFDANGIRVEFRRQDAIHFVFLINGIEVPLSLSRTTRSLTPKKLYDIIIKTRDNLLKFDFYSLEKLAQEAGGRTVLCIMLALYKSESILFLTESFRWIYKNYRRVPFPRKMLKTTFHCSLNNIDGVGEFLGTLEQLIPEAEQYLLDTTNAEIGTDKPTWVLFESKPGGIKTITIKFNFGSPLDQELRDYLRDAAEPGIKSRVPVALFLLNKWTNIRRSLEALEKLGIHISSIADLKPADCLSLQSFFAQTSNLDNKTQRTSLLETKAFYQFTADQYGLAEKSPFDYIHLPRKGEGKHTLPITDEALRTIEDKIAPLPMCFRLAFCVAVLTGARALSICSLTKNALVKEDGVYYLIIFHNKTAITHTNQNRPNFTKHQVDQDFAVSLLEFISDTEDLRRQLDTPYIFVYQALGLREGSRRKPKVLTHSAFADKIEQLLDGVPLFHTDGTPVRCNFKSIRAAVGHALFLKGNTAEDVARMLGNTPQVAATHYNTMGAREEAELYNQHYNATFAGSRAQIEQRHKASADLVHFPSNSPSQPVMYGNCESDNNEHCNKNDCNNCQQRIVCREKGQSKKEACI